MNYERGLYIKDADNERKRRERCLKNAERRAMKDAERKAMKDAVKEESKTKQLLLLVTPSMLERIKGKALSVGLSVNGYIRNLIEEDLKNEL